MPLPDSTAFHPGYVLGAQACGLYEKMAVPNFADQDFSGIIDCFALASDRRKGPS